MTLAGRVALITGSKRTGAAVARRFAETGARCAALAYNRSRDEAEAGAGAIRALERRAVIVQADLSRPEGCACLADTTAR